MTTTLQTDDPAENSSFVSPFSQIAKPSYNQTQKQQVMDKLSELLTAIKRP